MRYQFWCRYGYSIAATYLPFGQYDAHIDCWRKFKWRVEMNVRRDVKKALALIK